MRKQGENEREREREEIIRGKKKGQWSNAKTRIFQCVFRLKL